MFPGKSVISFKERETKPHQEHISPLASYVNKACRQKQSAASCQIKERLLKENDLEVRID